jgi:glycosyltransferase involved in cell wall biosynthesis
MTGQDEPETSALASQRIAVLTNVPNHYRVPLWNRLHARLDSLGASLQIVFTAGASARARPWVRHQPIEFDHRFLRSGRGGLPADLVRRLAEFEPTLVLSGGFSPLTTGQALVYARRRGIPFGVWSGDTARQARSRGQLRRWERRWILRNASFALAYGRLAKDYLHDLAPDLPVVIGKNTAPIPSEPVPGSSNGLVEFLSLGQAIERKGHDVVIDAFRLLDDERCRLTVAGGGPELESLRARAAGDERIRVVGAVESDRILDCYRGADVFLFPSRADVFGLVLVEALGSGVATITASAPASTADLAVDRENCVVVDGHSPERWADAIRDLAGDAGLRQRLGARGRATILGSWTVDHSVDAWIEAFELAYAGAGSTGGAHQGG